jgi:pimeloyl-ACP methyl ester carboxylesterase
MRKFHVPALLAFLSILLGLAACGRQDDRADLSTFEAAPCPMELPTSVRHGEDIVCGYVTVPEEHAHPEGETVRLAVAVVKSTNEHPAPDPLVMEAGGPGVSTLAQLPSMLPALADLWAQRDVVLVEQRGTLYAKPHLLCEKALPACRDRFLADGVNLSAYNSLEITADIVMALTALGYEKFNFYGVSYSTMLAQHMMRDYPERLRSVILDSVAPLSVNGFVQLPNGADEAFHLLFESCAADPACSHHFPSLERVFFELVEELNRDPVTVHFDAPQGFDLLLTGDLLIAQLSGNLRRGPVSMLPAHIYAMANGDYGWLESLGAPSSPNDVSLGMHMSVLCTEQIDYTDADFEPARHYAQIAALIREGSDLREACAVWNVKPLSDDVGAPVVSDIPTLILSGEFDPNTPPSGGSLVAETLSHSYVYTFPGLSHNVVSNSLCARSIVLDFLADPTQEPEADCVAGMGRQFVVPADEVELEPFTDPVAGLQGVLPASWATAGPGLFVGLNSRGDLAFLLVLRLPDNPLDQNLTPRLQRLGVGALPESTGRRETTALAWDLYTFEGNLPTLGGKVMVDYAIAETQDGDYLVGLHTAPGEYEDLHEAVFLPVVDALAPLPAW